MNESRLPLSSTTKSIFFPTFLPDGDHPFSRAEKGVYASNSSMAAPTAPVRAWLPPSRRAARFWRPGVARVEVEAAVSSAGTRVVEVMVTTAPSGWVLVRVSTISLEEVWDRDEVVVMGGTVEVVRVVSVVS